MRDTAERAYAAKAEAYKRLSLNGHVWQTPLAQNQKLERNKSSSGASATSSSGPAAGSSNGGAAGAGVAAAAGALARCGSAILPNLCLGSVQVEQDPRFLAKHSISHILQVCRC